MAWFAVDENIYDNPKIRRLHKAIRHKSGKEISVGEVVGYVIALLGWGVRNAEYDGELKYAEREDIEWCLLKPNKGSNVSAKDVAESLIEAGWIEESQNGSLIIHDWEEWQEPWYKAKRRREADNERKRNERKNKSASNKKAETPPPQDAGELQQESLFPASKDGEQKQKKEEKQANEYSSGFEEFWEAYPRKDDKGLAYRKYKARLNDGYSDGQLLQAAQAYAAQVRRERTERKYTKQAKTFLGDTLSFTEYLPRSPSKAKADSGQNVNPFAEYLDGG